MQARTTWLIFLNTSEQASNTQAGGLTQIAMPESLSYQETLEKALVYLAIKYKHGFVSKYDATSYFMQGQTEALDDIVSQLVEDIWDENDEENPYGDTSCICNVQYVQELLEQIEGDDIELE